MSLPYGMQFLEKPDASGVEDFPSIYYDDASDCSMVCINDQVVPFVRSSLPNLSTVIVTRVNSDQPKDDEDDGDNWRSINTLVMTLTATKTTPESPVDDEDDIIRIPQSILTTITVTEVGGEGPQDDETEDILAGW